MKKWVFHFILAKNSLKVNSEFFSKYNNTIEKTIGGEKMPHYPRIRNLREDHDLTQTEMGKILSCSQRVYSNYERGDIDIPTQTLIRLAEFFRVSVDYLLGLTDNPERNR